MGGNAQRRPPELGRPLSIRAIVIGGVLVGIVGAVAVAALLYFYGGGTDQDRAGLDVVRTAGTLVVGTGGAVALLLAARRQRSTELTLEHQREVAAAAAQDAAEQRITELYTRAVDQLGNDQAPVRLASLHAVERLAQDNPAQRQTIVDLICAYLRMPYTPPNGKPPDDDAPTEARIHHEQQRQELQVRKTAQRILAAHLDPETEETFWPDIDLDLTEAHLHNLNLAGCYIRESQFSGAQFSGRTSFARADFSGYTSFIGARFFGRTWFEDAQFSGLTWFNDAQFSGHTSFDDGEFSATWFEGTQFSGPTAFRAVRFFGNVNFTAAQFSHIVSFHGAQFSMDTTFKRVKFSEDLELDGVQFSGEVSFAGSQFSKDVSFNDSRFLEDAMFAEAQFFDFVGFARARFSGDAWFPNTQFSGDVSFATAQFSGDVVFDRARARPVKDGVHSWPAPWTTRQASESEESGWLYLARVEQ